MIIGNVVRTGQINRQKAFSTNKPEVVDFPTTVCTDCGAVLSEGVESCTPCETARKITTYRGQRVLSNGLALID